MSGRELQPHEMSNMWDDLPDIWRNNGGFVGWGLGAAVLIAGLLLTPQVTGNEPSAEPITVETTLVDNTPGAIAVPPKSDQITKD